MKKWNDEGIIYINELDIVGHDRTGRPGKSIYDCGNGKIKKISINRIGWFDLFKDKYKDWS